MKRRSCLEDPWEEMRLRQIAEEAESIKEAILKVLDAHWFPLTFNDIMRVMPERFRHSEKIKRALNRLNKERKVVEIFCLLPRDVIKGYATPESWGEFIEFVCKLHVNAIRIEFITND